MSPFCYYWGGGWGGAFAVSKQPLSRSRLQTSKLCESQYSDPLTASISGSAIIFLFCLSLCHRPEGYYVGVEPKSRLDGQNKMIFNKVLLCTGNMYKRRQEECSKGL